jgi:cytochrome P450
VTQIVRTDIPEHVFTDIDLYNIPGGSTDPQLAWRGLQGDGPIRWSPMYGGFWIITEGKDIAKFYRDTERLSSKSITIPHHGGPPLVPAEADGDEHRQYRRTIEQYFNAKNIAALEPVLRQDAIELIEAVRSTGKCDFVSDFSRVYPLTVFLRLVGLPIDDREYLYSLVSTIALQSDADLRAQAAGELVGYLNGWIEKRIAEPSGDAISTVVEATIDGRPYTREEMVGTLFIMLSAGLDTTTATMGFVMLHLARHPEHRAFMRDNPKQVPRAINELMRRYAVTSLARVATQDFEYGDVTIREGDKVYLPIPLYNLEESLFPNAEEVDLARPPKHITFGSGPHACVGANLARSELNILIEEWLGRIPEFSLQDDDPVSVRLSQNALVDKLLLQW